MLVAGHHVDACWRRLGIAEVRIGLRRRGLFLLGLEGKASGV